MSDQKHTHFQDLSGYTPTWCPGCGDWGIVRAIKNALSAQKLGPSDIFVCFDIGCSGNMNDFLNAYSMHTLHGRSVASAVGIKLMRPDTQVLVIGGDGGIYGEGGNHFVHTCRGNHDITMVVHDNMVYGLTTGQTAPTANKGYKSKSTPQGIIEIPVNPLAMAITQGATFVAQSFANNVQHVSDMIRRGMQHRGTSLVNVLQPCVTFNKMNTYDYFFDRTYSLPDTYDRNDKDLAMKMAMESTVERFPLGVIYEDTQRLSYTDTISANSSDHLFVLKDKNEVIGSIQQSFV